MNQEKENITTIEQNNTIQYTIVDVLVPIAIDKTYRYKIPQNKKINGGEYVEVQFGKQKTIAVIQNLSQTEENIDENIKAVEHIFDIHPMSEIQRRFIHWMGDYTITPKGMILKLSLNARTIFKNTKNQPAWTLHHNIPKNAGITPKRQKIIDYLNNQNAPIPTKDLIEKIPTSHKTIKKMEQDNILKKNYIAQISSPPQQPKPHCGQRKKLSREQKNAVEEIKKNNKNGFSVTLLDGVTGAGKTEIYLEVIAEEINRDAQAQILILLPEIALTKAFIERASSRLNAGPAEWHSNLTQKTRAEIWKNIAEGTQKIVIGTRSALFLPFKNLKIIVVDEEHDLSFKQEDGVIYNARDMSVAYAAIGKFSVILSSATPTLETITNVHNEKYHHVKIKTRHANINMPEIKCINMRRVQLPANQWIAPPLENEIRKNLHNKEQSLLFINRRGYAPLTLCRKCGARYECPNCKSWLVYHQKKQKLICHHCGHMKPYPKICPQCDAENTMVACGPGVERLAEEVRLKFPNAQTATLSSDLVKGKNAHRIIEEIVNGKYDIIVGTQIIIRGHDFENLTLAALIDADTGLEITNHRAAEHAFQTITQIAGRTGRREKNGRAFIQTYHPEHPLMHAMQNGHQEAFLHNEIHIRKTAKLPPFGKLAAIIVSSKDNQNGHQYAQNMAQLFPKMHNVILYGPAPAPISPLRNQYRYRFLIKAEKNVRIQEAIRKWIEKCKKNIKNKKNIKIHIDIDPYNFM